MNPLKRGRGDAPTASHDGSQETVSGRRETRKIAAFNVNGLNGKIDDCLKMMDEQKMELMFLSETWLKADKQVPHRQIIVSLADNEAAFTRGHHGLALIVPNRNIEAAKGWSIVTDNVDRAYIVVKTNNYIAVGIYLPSSMDNATCERVLDRIRHTVGDTDKPMIIIGDMNARLRQTGDTITNSRGTAVARWMAAADFTLVQPQEWTWTFQSIGTGGRSIVDLVWGNMRAAAMAETQILAETDRAGSDHRPIIATLTVEVIEEAWSRPKTYAYRLSKDVEIAERYQAAVARNLEQAKWMGQQALSMIYTEGDYIISEEEVDEIYSRICKTLVDTTSEICKQKPRDMKSVIFATPELKQLRHDRRVLQKALDVVRNAADRRLIVEATRKVQRKIQEVTQALKTEKYRKFTERLAMMESSEKMRIMKAMARNRMGNRSKLDKEKVEEYAEYFSRIYQPDATQLETEIPARSSMQSRRRLAEMIFTETRVGQAAKQMANGKAPGTSNVCAEMIKYGGPAVASTLALLYQIIFVTQKIPAAWREALIVPVGKKGDTSLIENNRPISLTEVPRRIFERCLEANIKQQMKPLDITQGGFRERRSCYDQLAVLNEVALDATAKGSELIYMFLDIKAAYDTVDRNKLWRKCAEYRIGPETIGMLRQLFDFNGAKVVLCGRESRRFALKRGLLQGSTLSPLLYSIFIDGMLVELNRMAPMRVGAVDIACLAYADDLALIARKESDAQAMLDTAARYAREHHFAFAPSKCEIVSAKQDVCLTLDGERLRQSNSFNYLGMPFDKRGLNAKMHISRLQEKARKALYALKDLGMNAGGFDIATNSQVLKCFVRSRLEYAIAILPLRKTNELRQLQASLNEGIRLAMGMWSRGVNAEVMASMFNIEDMTVRWTVLRCRWLESNRRKDASFLVHHGQRMHEERKRTGSCFGKTKHIRDTEDEIRRRVEQMLETKREIRQMLTQRGMQTRPVAPQTVSTAEHVQAWKDATKEWREECKTSVTLRNSREYRALSNGTHRMIATLHGDRNLVKYANWWILRKWPPRPKRCNWCRWIGDAALHSMRHFGQHASDGDGVMPMAEMDRLCVEAASLASTRGNRRQIVDRMRTVTREMAAYEEMWRTS
jgi:exonuclease III